MKEKKQSLAPLAPTLELILSYQEEEKKTEKLLEEPIIISITEMELSTYPLWTPTAFDEFSIV